MFIKRLTIRNFRNYKDVSVVFKKNINIVIGCNAQGKTSLIESLYVLSTTKSHRTTKDLQLILFNEKFSRIEADVNRGQDDFELSLSISRKGKKATLNGVTKKKLSDYIGKLIVVMFAPEDLSLIKGAPSYRRRFIDMEIGQISPTYLYHSGQYSKLLKQRNELLKQSRIKGADELFLDVLTEQLIEHAIYLVNKRIEFLEQLQTFAKIIHSEISNHTEEISFSYLSSFKETPQTKEALLQKYQELYDQDIGAGFTTMGPHRDDFMVSINEINAHQFGSQGQQRTVALAIKLAELELIYKLLGEYPVLLLDDVLSELDDLRQTKLLNTIKNKIQTFITTTTIDGIDQDLIDLAQIFTIDNAEIRTGDER